MATCQLHILGHYLPGGVLDLTPHGSHLGNFIFLTGPLLQDSHNLEWEKALIAIFSTLLLEVIFIQQPLYATVDTGQLSWHPLEQQRTTNLNTKPIEPTIRV